MSNANYLSKQLNELQESRAELIRELEGVEDRIANILSSNNEVILRKDVNGAVLCVGDKVKTSTKGKYNERTAKVLSIKDGHASIQFIKSKYKTWTKSFNLVKIDD